MWQVDDLDSQLRAAIELILGVGAVAVALILAVAIALALADLAYPGGGRRASRGSARNAGRHVLRALPCPSGDLHLSAEPPRSLVVRDFPDAMAELASGVCVVTVCADESEPCGMVATSLCSYSADPPSVLICVGHEGRSRGALLSARAFGVHVLCEEQQEVARWFARPCADRFAAVDWTWDADVPALAREHVVAYLRCARVAVKRHGDHAIVIGEVERVETTPREPLVYLRRRMDWRLESISQL